MKKGIILVIFVACGFLCYAQDDSTSISLDTLVTNTHPTRSESDSSRFAEISDTLSIDFRSIPQDARNKMRQQDAFWYANTDLKKSKQEVIEERERGVNGKGNAGIRERKEPFTFQRWFQNLLWIIIVACFIFFLIIYLGNTNVSLFRRKVKPAFDTGAEPDLRDIFSINYEREIRKALSDKNYRIAVRLQFLRILKKMADTNRIRYKPDKTNFDYLVELQPTAFYNPFFRATRSYEYSWYGQFPVSEDSYNIIKSDFEQLDRQLNNH